LGYRFAPSFGMEVLYGRTRSELEAPLPGSLTNNEIRDSRLSLDGYYVFNTEGRFSPYLLAGGGNQRFKTVAPAATPVNDGTFANAAVGAFINLSDNIAIRTEVRDVYNFDTENNDVLALLGLTFKGTGGARAEKAPTPMPEPAAVAEEEPAPAPAPAPEEAAPVDSDNDGVADSADKCPNTPAGVKVDQDGCPLDSDKDGVPDYLDKCPDTAAGVVVDDSGCAKVLTEKISKDIHITFDSGKSVVKDEFKGDIEAVAQLAQQYPTAFIEIQGHTDSSGKADLNTKLSQARADAVKDVLVNEYKIDAARITAKGYGSSQPIADNKTVEGRAQNRRVIAVLSGEAKKVQMKSKKK
jgi:OOP family OmpA-OmpF porin